MVKYQIKSKEDNLDNHTEMDIWKNGTIVFKEKGDMTGGFIFLYPKQAKKLIRIIKKYDAKRGN